MLFCAISSPSSVLRLLLLYSALSSLILTSFLRATHFSSPLPLSLSSMSTSKKRLIISKVTVNLGCSSCRRPRLSSVFNPKPRRKTPTSYHKSSHYYSSSGCSWDTNTTTFSPEANTPAYYSSDTESDIKSLRAVQGFGKIGGESVAVEKDSDDPYLDFRQSMLQMILEKEIYSKDDLKELLNCFLQLNSPHYHGVIVRAFTEIWNGVFSVRSGSPKLHGPWKSRDY